MGCVKTNCCISFFRRDIVQYKVSCLILFEEFFPRTTCCYLISNKTTQKEEAVQEYKISRRRYMVINLVANVGINLCWHRYIYLLIIKMYFLSIANYIYVHKILSECIIWNMEYNELIFISIVCKRYCILILSGFPQKRRCGEI